jgi:hypothetical protein
MEAGRALDALVAEQVMGWTDFLQVSKTCQPEFDVTATPPDWSGSRYHRVPDYSTNIVAAVLVEEALVGKHLGEAYAGCLVREVLGGKDPVVLTDAELLAVIRATPVQRCRAALAVMETPR